MLKVQLFRRLFASAALVLFSSEVFPNPNECNSTPSWQRFGRETGLSASPIQAHNFRTDWPISQENIEQTLAGNPVQKFPEGTLYMGVPTEEFNLIKDPFLAPFALLKEPGLGLGNFEKIALTLAGLVRKRGENELLLIHTGVAHAIDLYYSLTEEERSSVQFVQEPTLYETRFIPNSFPNDHIYTKFPRFSDLAGAAVFGTHLTRMWYHTHSVQRPRIVIQNQEKAESQCPSVVVMMELHRIESSRIGRAFPTLQQLSETRFKKVKIAIEGLLAGLTYSSTDAYQLTHEVVMDDQKVFAKFIKPTLKEIVLKMNDQHPEILPVEYVGLEPSIDSVAPPLQAKTQKKLDEKNKGSQSLLGDYIR